MPPEGTSDGRPDRPAHARHLPWPAVDPSRNPFEWDEAEHARLVALVTPMVPVVPSPGRVGWQERHRFTTDVTALLTTRYGPWASGWNWAYGEGGGGGVVTGWCCTSDSVGEPQATAEAVAASLVEWRDWLEELAERFAELAPPEDPESDAADRSWHVERAATRLVTVVVDRTGAQCGWYGHCHTVLTWYVTSTGMDLEQADEAVARAIGGRFASWTSPRRTLVDSVGEDLAIGLTGEPPYRER